VELAGDDAETILGSMVAATLMRRLKKTFRGD
jgi:hypothetical protein